MRKNHGMKKQSKAKIYALILLIFTTSSLQTALANNPVNLPDMGVAGQETLTTDQENRLGRMFMQAVRQQTTLLEDPICNQYLQKLGTQLTTHTSAKNRFHFFMVDDPSINAFAGPGGYIGMNTGLISTSSNEAELAAVMAHEITHVTQRHIARGMENASKSTWPSVGAIVAALLLGGRVDSAITTGAIMTAAAGKMQHTINYTRRFEREADRIGMRVLFNTGFNPEAMPSFFARMQNRTLDYTDPSLKLLRTHPVTEERIADSQNRARHYSKRPNQLNHDYPLVKARIQVITSSANQDILSYFHSKYRQEPNNEANRYGYALALTRNHQEQASEKILTDLVKQHPKVALYQLALAEAQRPGNASKSSSTLKSAYGQFPQDNAVILNYGKDLLKTKQVESARNLLEKHHSENQYNPNYFAMLAQAQGKSGHIIAAYQSRAEQFTLENHLRLAIVQLQQAIKFAKDKPYTIHHLQEKITTLKHEIATMEQS